MDHTTREELSSLFKFFFPSLAWDQIYGLTTLVG